MVGSFFFLIWRRLYSVDQGDTFVICSLEIFAIYFHMCASHIQMYVILNVHMPRLKAPSKMFTHMYD